MRYPWINALPVNQCVIRESTRYPWINALPVSHWLPVNQCVKSTRYPKSNALLLEARGNIPQPVWQAEERHPVGDFITETRKLHQSPSYKLSKAECCSHWSLLAPHKRHDTQHTQADSGTLKLIPSLSATGALQEMVSEARHVLRFEMGCRYWSQNLWNIISHLNCWEEYLQMLCHILRISK